MPHKDDTGWPGVRHQTASNSEWGDGSGFESLFLQNYSRVLAVLIRLIGDKAEAEELADDVFLKLYRHPLETTGWRNGTHNVGGWLYRTATRMGIDALRARARRQRYESDACANRADAVPADQLDEILRSEAREQTSKVLVRLKPVQAQLLILRHSGLSYKEIATALRVKPSTVGTLLARAAHEFEKRFQELFGGE